MKLLVSLNSSIQNDIWKAFQLPTDLHALRYAYIPIINDLREFLPQIIGIGFPRLPNDFHNIRKGHGFVPPRRLVVVVSQFKDLIVSKALISADKGSHRRLV